MAVKTSKQAGTPEELRAAEETPVQREPWSGYTHFVYIGPSLPGGALKQNAVLMGTFSEIKTFLADALEVYPQAERLIFPVEKLGEQLKRVKAPGNITHKYFGEIVSLISANRNREE